MLRRSVALLAVSVPRSVWDPAQHNPNWADSYSTDIADRRHWPAKKWSVGLEPRTPREWLQHSKRNLAYAYNGAMRACSSFPEMLVYYKEMKQRGVKVDVDTLNVLLTRAARYEKIQTDDIFLLFDEMTSLGARPDIAAVETLHTVLEHSADKPFEWREARRRQLVELYNYTALEELNRLASHKADALLRQQMKRLRHNLRLLGASLSPTVYRRYLAVVDTAELLLEETHNFLWEFVTPDHPALDVPSLQMRIPFLATVMKRPSVEAKPSELKPTDFEDTDVCSVFLAAVERAVDADFHDRRRVTDRRIYLSLLTMLTSSGVLYTADLMAQLMDMVKFSTDDGNRDKDAVRLLRYAMRGSSAGQDQAYRSLWRQVESVVDGRVVGRYLASRDPWSQTRICFDDSFRFASYPTLQMIAKSSSHAHARQGESQVKKGAAAVTAATTGGAAAADTDVVEGVREDLVDLEGTVGTAQDEAHASSSSASSASSELKTVEALRLRWSDVKQFIDRTRVMHGKGARESLDTIAAKKEVLTGQAVFLRTVATGRHYEEAAAHLLSQDGAGATATSVLFADDMRYELWDYLFQLVKEVHGDIEKFLSDPNIIKTAEGAGAVEVVSPDFECWESLLVILRSLMDFCVLHMQKHGKAAGGGAAEKLFRDAAELRQKLLDESQTRFQGRMRVLWLHEA